MNTKYYEYDGENEIVRDLNYDGDFKSNECTSILEQADIVVTNPPFSLFRDYVTHLIKFSKKFLIIGNMNAITYKEIFPYIKDNELWLGVNWIKDFIQPNKEIKKFGNICWYTNLDNNKNNKSIDLCCKYNETDYPHYDNCVGVEVSKVSEIPMGYSGVMGVPITFLDKYCPEQFEIVGNEYDLNLSKGRGYINGRRCYGRVFIRKKQ